MFIPTKACKEVEKLADSECLVIVTGHSGSGKSAIIQHIALKYRGKDWIVKPLCDVDELIDTLKKKLEDRTLLVLSNPIGRESFDEISYRSWKKYERRLQYCLTTVEKYLKRVKLLISSRKIVLFDKRVTGILRDESKIIDIDNQWKLSHYEKRLIWNKHTSNKNISEEEFAEIVEIETYFPLLCKLWSKNIHKPKHELRLFFKEPLKVFKDELEYFRKCDKEKYCVLVLLVLFNNKLCVTGHKLIDEVSKNKFQHALRVCGLNLDTPLNEIRDNLELLNGFLVKKIGDNYQFYHDFVMEVTTLVYGIDYPEDTIKYADTFFLRKRVKIKDNNEHSDPYTVYLGNEFAEELGKRLFTDIFGDHLLDVVLNPCLRNENVTKTFIDELKFHPEMLTMLLKTRKYKVETQERMTSENLHFSRLDILDVQDEISPLCALIVFCHTDLSLYCLQTLKDRKVKFLDNLLFSAVCCSGSMDLYNMFRKDQINKYLTDHVACINMASMLHNFEILKELLQFDVNINTKNDKEYMLTPLMFAVGNDIEGIYMQTDLIKNRRDATVKLLLDNKADINLCMEDGLNALILACRYKYDNTIQLLLTEGADKKSCMKNGIRPLHVASENGHDNIVQLLLNNEADINSCMEDGSTPLSLACLKRHQNTVELLLRNKADINLCLKDGTSPLHLACFNGSESIVKLLLRNGAHVNKCMEYVGSPLHAACFQGHNNIVKLLLDNEANINLSYRGISPLYNAFMNGYDNTVKLLLNNKADITSCEELLAQQCKKSA